ncbi:MAG: hypothetical protein H7Y22_15455 [Gemmatimonadaceae bacterium]|nr:hypothetical protein [Gloeobacterales cyanobacterium ES-bin-141]
MKYRGWTITTLTTRQVGEGFLAVLVDPNGKKLDGPRICLPSSESAEHYARKFIDWSITLRQ